ncbi:hypothetical protein QBC44DRAFT_149308 [Cladorrhinum sp. PSN332]|nr:hypothetical protein QBC44DRAFT_149308 [Cladorrhinum sp. PSN332]
MNSQDGRGMDRLPPPGSIKRARERAAAGIPRDDGLLPRGGPGRLEEEEEPRMARAPLGSTAGQRAPLRPQPPPGLQTRGGQIGVAISRPTQVPQWPLPASIMPQTDVDGEPYRPPPGRSEPPQRPPRPSRVPSILDATKVQDPTPVFQYRPRSERDSSGQDFLGIPETPTTISRQSTQSSVGSIPDFPVPVNIPPGPPRRSVNLGPPPSARRGASSFYSHLSYVSPIPEESPRSRSHTSFASSAAMPESWGTPSPGQSPQYPEAYYDDTIIEEGSYDGNDDEARLVRNASVGKLARPMLVSAVAARALGEADQGMRPGPSPIQSGPFSEGTGYAGHSSSSSTIPVTARLPIGSAATRNSIIESSPSLNSAEAPSSSSSGETTSDNLAPPGARPYSRLSAIRRPPRLDMDAVRQAEARGSLTSLPDLIKRATRLAASLEKGRRPASRFDDLNDYGPDDFGANREKHQSGLSDMLAAFPPPAQPAASSRRSIRNSIREHVQSWPLGVNFSRTGNTSQDAVQNSESQQSPKKQGRRCCGLPLWGFLVVLLVILILITAAIVIPLEFLVIQRQRSSNDAQAALQQCQQRLPCANGGTTVVNEGACGCLCANGFTGFDCTASPTSGCTTMSLRNMENVTVGDAIPRLIEQAQANFSIPLDGTEVVAKLNAGSLSCSAANALVTFDGSSTRQGAAKALAMNVNAVVIQGIAFTTITLLMGQSTTITVDARNPWPTSVVVAPSAGTTVRTTVVAPTTVATTFSVSRVPPASTSTTTPTVTSTVTATMSMSSGVAVPRPTFGVTEEVLDFARVAVLFILQESQLSDAERAQVSLQRFFTNAAGVNGQTVESARNITLGGGKSVDLVDFTVDAGSRRGVVGGTAS